MASSIGDCRHGVFKGLQALSNLPWWVVWDGPWMFLEHGKFAILITMANSELARACKHDRIWIRLYPVTVSGLKSGWGLWWTAGPKAWMSLIRSNTRVNKQSREKMPESEHDHRKGSLVTSRIIHQLHLNSFGCWSRWWPAKNEIRSLSFPSGLYSRNTSEEQSKNKGYCLSIYACLA